MLAYVHLFLQHAVFSSAVEAVVAAGAGKLLRIGHPGKLGAIAALGTLATIPYVWFVFPTLLYSSHAMTLLAGEAFAFVAEACLYRYACRISYASSFALSLAANAASYAFGQIMW